MIKIVLVNRPFSFVFVSLRKLILFARLMSKFSLLLKLKRLFVHFFRFRPFGSCAEMLKFAFLREGLSNGGIIACALKVKFELFLWKKCVLEKLKNNEFY